MQSSTEQDSPLQGREEEESVTASKGHCSGQQKGGPMQNSTVLFSIEQCRTVQCSTCFGSGHNAEEVLKEVVVGGGGRRARDRHPEVDGAQLLPGDERRLQPGWQESRHRRLCVGNKRGHWMRGGARLLLAGTICTSVYT